MEKVKKIKKKLNITFINRMMGIRFGGGENFDLNIARALKQRGHNVRFVIGVSDKYKEPLNIENEFDVIKVKTLYLRDIHYKFNSTNFLSKLISIGALELDLWLFENKVLNILKNDNWSNIYQICGLPRLGALLKRLHGSEKIVSIRWPGPPSRRKLKWAKQYDINIANGDALKIIKDMFSLTCEEVNPGVDIKQFYPARKKVKNQVNFLFVGRIVPIKNLSFLVKSFLEASRKRTNIVLKIVGDGEKEEIYNLKNMIKGVKNIEFLGKKTGKELVHIYQSSDVFCLTSKYENFPNVILEAMACGLPVIATNVGGIPLQVIPYKTGILIEPNNITQLVNAMLLLADNRELRSKMGKAGRGYVEKNFSWERSARVLEKIYYNKL